MTLSAKTPVPAFAPAGSTASTAGAPRVSAALALSIFLHAGLLALLLLAAWRLREEAKTPEGSFVVVPSGAIDAASPAGGLAPADRTRADAGVEAPDFLAEMRRRQRAEELRAEREIARMREQRRREEIATRELETQETKPAAETGVSGVPANTSRRSSLSRERISLSEFRRAHPGSSTASRTDAGEATPVAARIDLGALPGDGGAGAGVAGPRSATSRAVEASAMEAYFGDWLARLREAHRKPAGLSDLLSAEVEVLLAADGTVSGLRLVRSSTNDEFDRSVLDAFSRVRMPGRPDKKTDRVRITFRMRDA